MITIKQKGDFSKTFIFLEKIRKAFKKRIFDIYGQKGVAALASATPFDTGKTASSWQYRIDVSNKSTTLTFLNTNIQNGVPIAIILQYGHGTRNGGYVEGRDYINPVIQPLFDELAEELWKEIKDA